jgi:hypothetical protein
MKKLILTILLILPLNVLAYQPKPIDFSFNEDGEVFGMLEDGTSFSQINIFDEPRIQKFCWSECWYVSDKGIINTNSDLNALSIYFNSL